MAQKYDVDFWRLGDLAKESLGLGFDDELPTGALVGFSEKEREFIVRCLDHYVEGIPDAEAAAVEDPIHDEPESLLIVANAFRQEKELAQHLKEVLSAND